MSSNNKNNTSSTGFDLSSFVLNPEPLPPATITWCVFLGLIGIVALVTNLLTILAFTQKRLRRPPHYLLISLASADLMVASISVPIYLCINLRVAPVTLRSRAAFWFFDFLSGMASIFTLAAISLERLFAMGWPFHHRITSPQMYAVFITIPWLLALLVALLPVLDLFGLLPHLFMFYAVLASCCFPIVVTTVAYLCLWFKVRGSDASGHQRTGERDKRLAMTLVIATMIFAFTWLPYPIVLSIMNVWVKEVFSYSKLFVILSLICKFMHLSNSCMNPLVYILRIPEFRGAILEVICRSRPIRRVGTMATAVENITARSRAAHTTSNDGHYSNHPDMEPIEEVC